MPDRLRRPARGFTLVEILIVVVILGILAAIVVPRFAGASDEARQVAFITELKIFADAAEYYTAREGAFVEDSSSGQVPSGFENYIKADGWLDGSPIGGDWDAELNENGVTSGIGVHFQGGTSPGDDFMRRIDERFDDGELSTGSFRQLTDSSRFYWVIAD